MFYLINSLFFNIFIYFLLVVRIKTSAMIFSNWSNPAPLKVNQQPRKDCLQIPKICNCVLTFIHLVVFIFPLQFIIFNEFKILKDDDFFFFEFLSRTINCFDFRLASVIFPLNFHIDHKQSVTQILKNLSISLQKS